MTLNPDMNVTGPDAAGRGDARVSGLAANVSGTSGAVTRDPRLDIFRGLAMFIILIAHSPGNWFANYIPARYGWSDAAEIFVFCSGMASAIAFGRVFDTAGWTMGTARVGYRIWQVYWGHIGLFFAIVGTMAALNGTGWFTEGGLFQQDYLTRPWVMQFFTDPGTYLPALLTLTYVPNYFDILPMYIVILMMLPIVMALHRVSPWAVLVVLGGLWLATQLGRAEFDGNAIADTFGLYGLSADPVTGRRWFFNPFAWQIVFYTGFALMRGWIPAPPVNKWLIGGVVLFVVASAPLNKGQWRVPIIQAQQLAALEADTGPDAIAELQETDEGRQELRTLRDAQPSWVLSLWNATAPLRPKTEEGILRYLHVLSLAYLAWAAAGHGGHRLLPRAVTSGAAGAVARVWNGALRIVTKVGQQSLAVFLFSMWFALVMGIIVDVWGKTESAWYWSNTGTVVLVNIAGVAAIIACAYTAAWFKSSPWKPRKSAR